VKVLAAVCQLEMRHRHARTLATNDDDASPRRKIKWPVVTG
jgi:hypothetical protein